MNRKLLALAITAALTAPFAAQAAPTVYGQLNLSVDMVDLETTGDDEFQVNSNSSRLGVKGEEDLGNGYSAVYKAEFGVDADEGVSSGNALLLDGNGDPVPAPGGFYSTPVDSPVLSSRDVYLGLKANWGTVKLGRYDSPLKSSQGNVDQFNDMTYADMTNYFSGENRMSNLIGYESPKIADAITIKLALQPGEDTAGGNDGLAEAMSASVAYEAGGLYLAAAMDKDVADGAFNETNARDAIRLVATYTMDALQFGAMIQTSEVSDEALSGQIDEEGFLLSAGYTMGKNVVKGQVAMNNIDLGGGIEVDSTFIGLGFDHNFTQMTKAYAQISMLNYDAGAADADDTVLTVGMQTKF